MSTQELSPISNTFYREHVNILRCYAWKYARVSSVSYEILFAEAQFIFLNCARKFNAGHTSGSSFINYLCQNLKALTHLITAEVSKSRKSQGKKVVQKKNSKASETNTVEEESLHILNISYDGMDLSDLIGKPDFQLTTAREIDEYLATMSTDAKQIVDWQIYGDLAQGRKAKRARPTPINAWSVYQRRSRLNGWDWNRTKEAYAEVTETLSKYIAAADLVEG